MGRTVEQAERECREAWERNPSDYGWCIHHKIEIERLTEPIGNRISFIINNKVPEEIIARLDNLRPVLSRHTISAKKAHREATAQARKAYQEDTARPGKPSRRPQPRPGKPTMKPRPRLRKPTGRPQTWPG